jgi:hypothetical protein
MKHEKKKRLFFCAKNPSGFCAAKHSFACVTKMEYFRGKRGYFFTLDAFIAVAVIILELVLVFSVSNDSSEQAQTEFFSQDLISLLASTRIYELNNEYVDSLEDNGTITNSYYTVLEVVGELFFLNKTSVISSIISNVTADVVPENYGFQILMQNQSVYVKNVKNEDFYLNLAKYDVLVTSKRIVSGEYNRSFFWGPFRTEVRVWR